MMDNTAIRDEIFGPPFMHTALSVVLMLNYRLPTVDEGQSGKWFRVFTGAAFLT